MINCMAMRLPLKNIEKIFPNKKKVKLKKKKKKWKKKKKRLGERRAAVKAYGVYGRVK